MEDLAVRLSDVHAAYEGEEQATLRGVNLEIPPGEQWAVTGPNGAGKTTLLEVINGLLPVVSGNVQVLGRPVSSSNHSIRSEISYVPQNLFFPPETPFLVQDVVLAARFGRIPFGRLPGRRDREQSKDALRSVGMAWAERRPVGRLSGGQQRKVLLARSLAQEATVLLLDEPTANLDPEAKKDLAELVCTVRDNLNATALIVSHESGPLLAASDRSIVMESGVITSIDAANVSVAGVG